VQQQVLRVLTGTVGLDGDDGGVIAGIRRDVDARANTSGSPATSVAPVCSSAVRLSAHRHGAGRHSVNAAITQGFGRACHPLSNFEAQPVAQQKYSRRVRCVSAGSCCWPSCRRH
jgi:hypothetical protein